MDSSPPRWSCVPMTSSPVRSAPWPRSAAGFPQLRNRPQWRLTCAIVSRSGDLSCSLLVLAHGSRSWLPAAKFTMQEWSHPRATAPRLQESGLSVASTWPVCWLYRRCPGGVTPVRGAGITARTAGELAGSYAPVLAAVGSRQKWSRGPVSQWCGYGIIIGCCMSPWFTRSAITGRRPRLPHWRPAPYAWSSVSWHLRRVSSQWVCGRMRKMLDELVREAKPTMAARTSHAGRPAISTMTACEAGKHRRPGRDSCPRRIGALASSVAGA